MDTLDATPTPEGEIPADAFAGVPCLRCGAAALRVEYRLTARPWSERYSVAGVQTKMAATSHPWMVCGNCGAECKGKR